MVVKYAWYQSCNKLGFVQPTDFWPSVDVDPKDLAEFDHSARSTFSLSTSKKYTINLFRCDNSSVTPKVPWVTHPLPGLFLLEQKNSLDLITK